MDVVKSIDEIRINMKTMDSYLVKANDPEYQILSKPIYRICQ